MVRVEHVPLVGRDLEALFAHVPRNVRRFPPRGQRQASPVVRHAVVRGHGACGQVSLGEITEPGATRLAQVLVEDEAALGAVAERFQALHVNQAWVIQPLGMVARALEGVRVCEVHAERVSLLQRCDQCQRVLPTELKQLLDGLHRGRGGSRGGLGCDMYHYCYFW